MVEDVEHKEDIENITISFNRGDHQKPDYPRYNYDNRSYPSQYRKRYGIQKAENFTSTEYLEFFKAEEPFRFRSSYRYCLEAA